MKRLKPLLLAVLAATALGAHAKYNGEDRGKPVAPAQGNVKWQTECGSCHMAFQPALLPAASWRKIMTGLDQHFGADASLPPAEVKEITDYLVRYESNRWTAKTAPLRISDSAWFKTKHSHSELSPAVWKRDSIKSPANCMACHSAADKGDFNEHNIRIPK